MASVKVFPRLAKVNSNPINKKEKYGFQIRK
jgi:hypothetical protein